MRILLLIVCLTIFSYAQTDSSGIEYMNFSNTKNITIPADSAADSTQTKVKSVIKDIKINDVEVKRQKNLNFNILGGPGYTPDYGFFLGGGVLLTFRTSAEDTTLQRSIVPATVQIMSTGGITFKSLPFFYFANDNFRMIGEYAFLNNISNYHGVGYDDNSTIVRGPETSQYDNQELIINPISMFRIGKSNIFLGPSFDFNYNDMSSPADGILEDSSYIAQGGDIDGLYVRNVGFGLYSSYDTRDLPANAFKGVLFELDARVYRKEIGSNYNYSALALQYRQYQLIPQFGERRLLSWEIKTRITSGDVPLTELSKIGSSYDIRGYYEGQYRDKHSLLGVVEYRHMFNFTFKGKATKLLNNLGFAAWGGAGSIAPKISEFEHALWNSGLGLRYEVQKRMNFRLDIGHSYADDKTLVYFGMTEAF